MPPSTLQEITPSSVTVLCDDEAIARAVESAGWADVRALSACERWRARPIRTAVLLTTDPVAAADARLDDILGDCGVLHVPLHAFDPSPAVAVYTLAMLRSTDFPGVVARNRRWVSLLEGERELHFTDGHGRGTALACTPADEITVATALRAELPPGVAMPVGLFFEVELERDERGHRPFSVNGTLRAEGVVYALGDDFQGDRARARSLADRVLRAAQPHGLELSVRDNLVVACATPDGRSCLPDLAEAVAGDLALSEFAIGTNRLERPDFALNAQVNEGAGGIHLGLAAAEAAVHIDFIALDARRAPRAA
jgi:hypothetical protein